MQGESAISTWRGALPPALRPELPAADLARMRRYRHARLQAAMARRGVTALYCAAGGAVQYAAGPEVVTGDAGRATYRRTAALVVAGDDHPHLFTPWPEGAPTELDGEHVHPPLATETSLGAQAALDAICEIVGAVPERLAADDLSAPLYLAATERLVEGALVDAGAVLGPARIVKSPDELACIRAAQHLNETAMYDVQAALRPGMRPTDLTSVFFARIFELGTTGNAIDPIFQVMPDSIASGPFTTHGDVAFPLTPSHRILEDGDVLWVDTGLLVDGYASDFGRTWIVGDEPRPSPRQVDQYRRWCDVVRAVLDAVRPGATGADLTRAARAAVGGRTPWLAHFYLVHGVGTESAEPPLVGTDAGPEADERLVLEPGMVLVVEPVIWDDGYGGYRSEDIVAVTEDGWTALSAYPYDPFPQ